MTTGTQAAQMRAYYERKRREQALSEFGWTLKEGLIVALGVIILINLELFSASYAFETASERHLVWGYPREALQMSLLTATCGLAAFVFMRRASMLTDDVRPGVRRRGRQAKLIAFGFLSIAIWYAACAFTYEGRMARHESYIASDTYELDRATARNTYADPMDRREARYNLEQAVKPGIVYFPDIGGLALAVFLHALTMWSAGAMRRPTPLKAGEEQRIREQQARDRENAKRRAQDAANRKRQEQEKKIADKQYQPLGAWSLAAWVGGAAQPAH